MKNKGISYYFSYLQHDLPSGLVVFLVALPLCVGIAIASGAPAFSGLITGVIGGVLVVWLSGSQLSVSGPAAGLTVIILNGIERVGSFELLLTAVLIAGILQIFLGFGKAGIIALYFPSSVIRGMLASIGLILIMKQIPHFLGIDEEFIGNMSFASDAGGNTFSHIYNAIFHVGIGPFLIGMVSFGILMLWERPVFKKIKGLKFIPGAFVAVVTSIFLNQIFVQFSLPLAIGKEHLVSLPIITSWGEFTSELHFPDWSGFGNFQVWIVGFTIAAIASIETLLSIEAADKLDPYKRRTPTNRELKAQGIGNILSALVGGIPMTAVIVRSSANITAGGRTKMAAFIHGLLLILTVFTIPEILNLIPLSTLAAILILIGFKLTKPVLYNSQFKLGPEQFIPFITTIVAVLFTDLLMGIAVGMAVGIFYVLKANYQHAYSYKKKKTDLPTEKAEVIHISLSEHVSFINKASIAQLLDELPEDSDVEISGENTMFIDYDVLEVIYDFRQTAIDRNINLTLVNLPAIKLTKGFEH